VTTIKVGLTVDRSRLEANASQVPYALSRTILRVLKTGQAAQLEHMGQKFTIRRKDFARLSVKIVGFPNKNRPVGEIAISSPGGRSDIFAKFEDGKDKFPHAGRHFLAVPRTGSLVKKRQSSIVPPQLRPAALKDSLTLRTFVKPFKKDPSKLGIFAVDRVSEARARRTGKKRDSNRARPTLLYTLIDEAPIKDSLEFVKTITDTVSRDFASTFDEEFANAVRTKR
jgi:hypothetical protein